MTSTEFCPEFGLICPHLDGTPYKYVTNDDHICRLYIDVEHQPWNMSGMVTPHNPQEQTIRLFFVDYLATWV